MRLPLPAVLAILAVAAAGSVVVTTHFKQPAYAIDARDLAVGQNVTVTLDFIPYKMYILSNVSSAAYYVVIIPRNAWLYDSTYGIMLTRRWEGWMYPNRTVDIPVAYVAGPVSCNITVTRMQ